jgi:hypothetical protein
MSRVLKSSCEEVSGAIFRRVLAEVASGHQDEREDGGPLSIFASRPLASAIFSLDAGPRMGAGGGSHWDAALAWIEEQDEPVPTTEPEPAPAPEDTPETILKELGPTEGLTFDQLNRLRRLYMWRNHPDRRGEAQRERATRRVAIANMLLDRAQSLLISSGRA